MNKTTTQSISTECSGAGLNRASARLIITCLLGVALELFVSVSALAQATKAAGTQSPPLMDRQKEISLALSACPSSVADKAAVYVLEKSGYVKIRESQNGFTAIVQHVTPASQEPQCMDAEGTRTFLPRVLKVAELRAQGKSSDEIRAFVSQALAKGVFPVPTRPGIIYMLSSQNFNTNGKGETFPPHVMLYGTRLTNADLGVDGKDVDSDGNPKGPAFVAGEGSPYSLIIVPVLKHSGQDFASADKPSGGSRARAVRAEATVQAPISEVWRVWTTSQGAQEFFAEKANIRLVIGGPYEIQFDPHDERSGTKGLKILSYVPEEMISFQWNAPPEYPEVRNGGTWVVVQMRPEGPNRTHVSVTHLGWKDGPEWDQAFAHFVLGWGGLMKRLERRFTDGPIDWNKERMMYQEAKETKR